MGLDKAFDEHSFVRESSRRINQFKTDKSEANQFPHKKHHRLRNDKDSSIINRSIIQGKDDGGIVKLENESGLDTKSGKNQVPFGSISEVHHVKPMGAPTVQESWQWRLLSKRL